MVHGLGSAQMGKARETCHLCLLQSLLEDLLPIWRKPLPIIEEHPDLHFPLTLKRRGQGEQDCEEEEEKVFYQTPDG